MIPAQALGFMEWEDRQLVWAETLRRFRELPLCDECGLEIDDPKKAVALYVNRLQDWTLVHTFRCGVELVIRENGYIEDARQAQIVEENTPTLTQEQA